MGAARQGTRGGVGSQEGNFLGEESLGLRAPSLSETEGVDQGKPSTHGSRGGAGGARGREGLVQVRAGVGSPDSRPPPPRSIQVEPGKTGD